jgi:hypothetical protein
MNGITAEIVQDGANRIARFISSLAPQRMKDDLGLVAEMVAARNVAKRGVALHQKSLQT